MKYDKEHIDRILNSLKEGSGRYAAAKAGNISFETFCEWMRTKTEFSDNVKKAEFEGQAYEKYTLEKNIKNASDKYGNPVWQSSAWLLERKYPKEYGLNQRSEEIKLPEIKIEVSTPEMSEVMKKAIETLNKK